LDRLPGGSSGHHPFMTALEHPAIPTPFVITHAPGRMPITDRSDESLA
jgi:uncharacterized protein YcsI (UPF0317 family)